MTPEQIQKLISRHLPTVAQPTGTAIARATQIAQIWACERTRKQMQEVLAAWDKTTVRLESEYWGAGKTAPEKVQGLWTNGQPMQMDWQDNLYTEATMALGMDPTVAAFVMGCWEHQPTWEGFIEALGYVA